MCIICVDEDLSALNSLKSYLKELVPTEIVYAFLSSEDALNRAENGDVSIAFVAVENREIPGIDLVERLKLINPEMNIIMTSICCGYLKEAIRLHASGFLEKPLTVEKIEKEMNNLLYSIV